jgi:predicted NBD/HSP70 family sugar kinase
MEAMPAVPSHFPDGARELRWQSALALIGEMRRNPGVTRAQAARHLGMSSGLASDVVARLRGLALIDEVPVPAPGRGRPTRVLSGHAEGPVALALDLRQSGWRSAYAGLDAAPHSLTWQPYPSAAPYLDAEPEPVIARLRDAVRIAARRLGRRLRVVSVAVAGTVQHDHVVESAALGWSAVDLAGVLPAPDRPLLVGNDATMAGLAEARSGAAGATMLSLHLSVEVGIGGVLVAGGVPMTGASGAGGEFGHLPFGDPALQCPCGACGCWDLEVDGRALARHLGEPAPRDPYGFALAVLGRVGQDTNARSAAEKVAGALGRGVAGLVNAHDPEVVTLGGLGGLLVAAAGGAFDHAYRGGLMRFRREAPPAVVPATYSDDGALRGALAAGIDLVLTERGLDAWSAGHAR